MCHRFKSIPANKKLDMPAGPLQAQGESVGSCPKPTLVPSYLHGSTTIKSLSGPHQIASSIRMLNLDEVILLVGGPSLRDKVPLRGLPFSLQRQINNVIFANHDQLHTLIFPHAPGVYSSSSCNNHTAKQSAVDKDGLLGISIKICRYAI